MCKCQTLTTEQGRHKIIEKANKEKPIYGLTPYGLDNRIKHPQKQIVKNAEYSNKYSKTRKNTSTHAKIILNKKYAITGSTNFTTNSIQNEHEIIQIIHKECHPEKYQTIKNFFETMWQRSEKVE